MLVGPGVHLLDDGRRHASHPLGGELPRGSRAELFRVSDRVRWEGARVAEIVGAPIDQATEAPRVRRHASGHRKIDEYERPRGEPPLQARGIEHRAARVRRRDHRVGARESGLDPVEAHGLGG